MKAHLTIIGWEFIKGKVGVKSIKNHYIRPINKSTNGNFEGYIL